MAAQKVMREHLLAHTRIKSAHGRAAPSDAERTPEFRPLQATIRGKPVVVSKKDAPASLELDKDGTIHCVLEDTSVGVEERDAQLKAAVISRLSLDDNPNKVCLFKVTAEQLERVSIVGSMITFYLRRRDDDPLRPVGVVGADTAGVAVFQVVCMQTFTAARFSRGLITLLCKGPNSQHTATSSGPRRLQGLVEPYVRAPERASCDATNTVGRARLC